MNIKEFKTQLENKMNEHVTHAEVMYLERYNDYSVIVIDRKTKTVIGSFVIDFKLNTVTNMQLHGTLCYIKNLCDSLNEVLSYGLGK